MFGVTVSYRFVEVHTFTLYGHAVCVAAINVNLVGRVAELADRRCTAEKSNKEYYSKLTSICVSIDLDEVREVCQIPSRWHFIASTFPVGNVEV